MLMIASVKGKVKESIYNAKTVLGATKLELVIQSFYAVGLDLRNEDRYQGDVAP